MKLLSLHLLLAALLIFTSDMLHWPDPTRGSLLDWLPMLAGYLALGMLLLDLTVRFRVRHVFGLLALAGIYSLTASLALNPRLFWADFPLTLISQVLGAQTLAALFALMVLLALLRGKWSWGLLLASGIAGIVWGILGRWFPAALTPGAPETPYAILMLGGLVGLGMIAVLWWLAARAGNTLNGNGLLLSPVGWLIVAGVLAGLIAWHWSQGVVDALAVVIGVSLVVFLALILSFQRTRRGVSRIEAALPVSSLRMAFVIPALVWLAGGSIGYVLPRGVGEIDLLNLLGTLLVAFGLVWLPAVSLVLGGRALMRQVRAQQL